MMKKMISKILLFVLLFNFGVLNTFADNIDPSLSARLHVSYRYDDIAITDTDISLYFLASIDASGNYQFSDSYIDISFDPSDMSSSLSSLKAEEVLSYIDQNQLIADFYKKTDQTGMSDFYDLVPGLYLVSVGSKTVDDYQYYASPILLTVPMLEDGTYQYDVSMNVKVKRDKQEEVISPGDTNHGESVPNTLDNIYLYVGLLVISLLVVIGVIIYILKRKGEKNENKNKK